MFKMFIMCVQVTRAGCVVGVGVDVGFGLGWQPETETEAQAAAGGQKGKQRRRHTHMFTYITVLHASAPIHTHSTDYMHITHVQSCSCSCPWLARHTQLCECVGVCVRMCWFWFLPAATLTPDVKQVAQITRNKLLSRLTRLTQMRLRVCAMRVCYVCV